MSDEQVVKLLEEIRDLQKSHLESYRQAVSNQDESINMQRGAARRAKIIQLIFAIFLFGILLLLWFARLH